MKQHIISVDVLEEMIAEVYEKRLYINLYNCFQIEKNIPHFLHALSLEHQVLHTADGTQRIARWTTYYSITAVFRNKNLE